MGKLRIFCVPLFAVLLSLCSSVLFCVPLCTSVFLYGPLWFSLVLYGVCFSLLTPLYFSVVLPPSLPRLRSWQHRHLYKLP